MSRRPPGPGPFELIVSDVDGTLLDSANRLSPFVERALARARRAGLRLCLASGRSGLLLEPLLEQLELRTPFVACGGAYAADPQTGTVLLDAPIPLESAAQVVHAARAHGVGLLFEQPREVWIEADAATTQRVLTISGGRARPTPDLLSAPRVSPRKITLVGSVEALRRTRHALDGRDPGLHIVGSTAAYLDVTRAGVTKGAAVAILARHLGVPLERTVAFGDGPNDLEMLAQAGLGVAMANAPEHVRQAAHWVAPSNDEAGLAWALHALLGDTAEAWQHGP